MLLLLFVCQLNRFQARSLVVEDDVNSAADKLEGSRRDARYILIRRKPIPYNSDPIPYNSNFVYPPVNFLANGKPSKIVVNGVEYNGESEKKPTLAGNKEDDIVSVKPAAPSRPNSPITWISGRVQYYKFYFKTFKSLFVKVFFISSDKKRKGSEHDILKDKYLPIYEY